MGTWAGLGVNLRGNARARREEERGHAMERERKGREEIGHAMERRSPVIVNLGLGSFHVSIELDACRVRKCWERGLASV